MLMRARAYTFNIPVVIQITQIIKISPTIKLNLRYKFTF